MKEYSEQEIYDIDSQFKARIKEQQAEAKRFFLKLLLIALAILAAGFFIGIAVAK